MIDYFVARMDGIRNNFTLADVDRHRADRAQGYRLTTAGVVVGRDR